MVLTTLVNGNLIDAGELNVNFKHNYQYDHNTGTTTLTDPTVTFTPTSASSIVMIFGNYNVIDDGITGGILLVKAIINDDVAGALITSQNGAEQASGAGALSVSPIWVGTLTAATHTITLQCSSSGFPTPTAQTATLLVLEFLA